jgi:hypothetical protein
MGLGELNAWAAGFSEKDAYDFTPQMISKGLMDSEFF